MGLSGNFTLFTNSAGGGSSASDYLKDNFSDTTSPPTNNSGFSSTISTNPFTQYFGNDNSVKYGVKTLWIKDLVLLEDRNQWVNSKPTYEIIWNETFPGVFGYVFGNVRLKSNPQGVSVEIRNLDDGVGVCGVIRKAAFFCNPNALTGSADIVVDGTDSGTDVTFGPAAALSGMYGINVFHAPPAATQDQNIHDYRLTANQNIVMSVSGVEVYFENSGNNLEILPGSTYVDKTKATSVVGSTLSLPTYTGRLGGVGMVVESNSAVLSTTNLEIPTIETIGVGASGGISIDVTTGQGSSFVVGSGVVGIAGTSFYVGTIRSISTDTFTVGPTITFGLSGPLYQAWTAGPTYAISSTFYILSEIFDPGKSNVLADQNGFGNLSNGDFYYSNPTKDYRAWGDALSWSFLDGYNGVGFTNGSFLQLTGRFSAAEVELVASPGLTGVLHGTFSINGVAGCWGVNEPFVGSAKKTIFTNAGVGLNSFVFSAGASISNVIFSQINLYDPTFNTGTSFGRLAYLPSQMSKVNRGAINASMMALGTYQRLYADEMYLTGAWTRGTTHTQAGGVYYIGSSTNCQMTMNYFGTDYAIVGVQGASTVVTFNGGAASSSMNILNSVATLGFHTVVLSSGGATVAVSAFDYVRPKGELMNLQNFEPVKEISTIPQVFNQSETPQNPKAGDIWAQYPAQNSIWVYLFNRWNKFTISQSVDDPNSGLFVKSVGFSGSDSSTATTTTEMFNFISWLAGASAPAARAGCGSANSSYNGKHYIIDGDSTGAASVALTAGFNRAAWSTETNSPNARSARGMAAFAGFLYGNMGAANQDPGNNSTASIYYNGTSWTSGNTFSGAKMRTGCFVVVSLMSVVGGLDGGGSATSEHHLKNTSDAISAGTAIPTGSGSSAGGNANFNLGVMTSITAANNTTSYTWNGSAWSSSLTANYSQTGGEAGGCGSNTGGGFFVQNGGYNSSNTVTTSQTYNGIAFSTATASSFARGNCSGGVV